MTSINKQGGGVNFIKPIFKIMDQMSSDFKRICALYGMKPRMNIKH